MLGVSEVCYKKDGNSIFVCCPKCREEQELPLEEEWYSIDIKGNVYPVFVCMSKDRKCNCMVDLRLKDWRG